MKLGILGTGMIVKDVLTTIDRFDLEKIYILSTLRSKKIAEQLKEHYHLDQCFDDYQTLLYSDVDTIYVALPNHLHFQYAKQALENNKHVIIEKPITANTKELNTLIDLAKRKNKILIEAMNIHYLPGYQSMKQHLDQIGKVKIATFNYSQYSSRYDAFKAGTVLPAFDYHKAGGCLMDINVYNIHALVGLFGRPQKVIYHANVENHIDTSGIVMLDYGSFKAVAIGAKDCQAPVVCTIQGDEGYLRITSPASQMRAYELSDNKGHCQTMTFHETDHRLYYEFVEFIRIIDHLDYHKADEMLKISMIVSEIMEEARQQEGIVFDNDK